jgi:hypothetical protein
MNRTGKIGRSTLTTSPDTKNNISQPKPDYILESSQGVYEMI